MPIGAAIGIAGVTTAGATLSASSKASSASQKATDASVANNQAMLADEDKQQQIAIQAARDNTSAALQTVRDTQGGSLNAITASQLAARDANNGVWSDYRSGLTPYLDAGRTAVGNLANPNASFAVSPDYNFRLSQGEDAVTTNKAVNGLLKSGSALKAVNDYAQNTASGEFANWWSRQQGLAGTGIQAEGLDATGASGQVGANKSAADTISNATQANANAISNAAVGAGNTNTNVAVGAADNTAQAIANATQSNNNAIQANATNQGNAALATANGVSTGIGSIADLLAKYGGQTTASSYNVANNNNGSGEFAGLG